VMSPPSQRIPILCSDAAVCFSLICSFSLFFFYFSGPMLCHILLSSISFLQYWDPPGFMRDSLMDYYHSFCPAQFLLSVHAMVARSSTAYQQHQRCIHGIMYPHKMHIYEIHNQMRHNSVCTRSQQIQTITESGISKFLTSTPSGF
jgi:hypothetical protein